MNRVTVELEDGTKVVYDNLDTIRVNQNRPPKITWHADGSVDRVEPGKITTLSIVAVSERK